MDDRNQVLINPFYESDGPLLPDPAAQEEIFDH